METHKILQSDYLDLIFDKRNKSYGSYELRKHYNGRALKALGFTFAALLLGVGTPFVWGKMHAKEMMTPPEIKETVIAMNNGIHMEKVQPPKPPKPPVHPAATPPLAHTVRNTPPVIMKNNEVKPELKPPDVKELVDKVSGPANNPGQGGDAIAMNDKLPKGPVGDGRFPEGGPGGGGSEKKDDTPRKFAEEMPEYPGGAAALMAFLRSHINYPLAAREADIQGRVMISFVVNTNGEIENAVVARGIGGGCDKEALRVVNAMPRWKPGKQNGHLVKVYYTLPIAFTLDK